MEMTVLCMFIACLSTPSSVAFSITIIVLAGLVSLMICAKLRYNTDKMKIYIPGVSRERARELVLQHINQDPSLESLRFILFDVSRSA